jgi:CRP-like cAMP-binding protein
MTTEQIHLTQFLTQQYLSASLTLREISILLEYTELASFKKKDIIANIGEVGEALYFIVKGEATLLYDEAGQEIEVGSMKEGELMGEMSFFDRKPRLARLRAMANETQVLKLTRAKYKRLRVEHPYIAVNLLEHAIISLDHLVRRVSLDVATFNRYIYGTGGTRN